MADEQVEAKKGRKLVKGARTRALIKDAVLMLHATKSWNAITLTDICEATGLTVGAFYYHFDSKDQVAEEIASVALRETYETVEAEIRDQPDLFVVFHTVIAEHYQRYVRNPNLCRLSYLALMKQHRVYDVWLDARIALLDRLEAAIVRAREESDLLDGGEKFAANWLLTNLEDFLWNVFMARGNAALHSIASGQDAFIRQQAIMWYRSALGRDPNHPLARPGRRVKSARVASQVKQFASEPVI